MNKTEVENNKTNKNKKFNFFRKKEDFVIQRIEN